MNVKLLAVAIAAIICVATVGIYFVSIDDGGEEGPIQIVDGSGKTITLNEPLNNVVVVNTNIPKSMKILGLENEVVGIGYSTANTASNNASLTALFPNLNDIPYTKSITGESMATITKYVICPVNSMTLSSTQEADLNNLGVMVIRLDCNGDTALDDLEKLTILFGKTESVMNAYNSYYDMCNSVINTVKEKVALASSTAGLTFLSYMASSKSFYNQTSEISRMIETIFGQNALRDISGLNLTGVTNSATDDGIREAIVQKDSSSPIEKIFIRGAASSSALTVASIQTAWNDSVFVTDSFYAGLSAVQNNEAYVFNSNMMSGCLSFVGYILIAELCGIDTGYNVQEVIGLYNTTYGFTESTTGVAFQIVNGTATMRY